MNHTVKQCAAFSAVGAGTGTWVSINIGGMGLAFSGSAISLGLTPMSLAGATAGAAGYGLFRAVVEGDSHALNAALLGSLGGAAVSVNIGGMALAAKGTAISLGIAPLTLTGSIVGLAIYGLFKSLNNNGVSESAHDVFDRIDSRISWCEDYQQALLQLNLEATGGDHLTQRFNQLEIDSELQNFSRDLGVEYKGAKPTQIDSRTVEQRFRNLHIETELEALKAKMGISERQVQISGKTLERLESKIFPGHPGMLKFSRSTNSHCSFTTSKEHNYGPWWQVLGVNHKANTTTVKNAYHRLARLYHPDTNTSHTAVGNMQTVNDAYSQFKLTRKAV